MTDPERDKLVAACHATKGPFIVAKAAYAKACKALQTYDYDQRTKNICAATIQDTWFRGAGARCSRKNGQGLDGRYCGQHAKKYPAAPDASTP